MFRDIFVSIVIIVITSTILILGAVHFVAIGAVAEYEALVELVNELGIDARTEDILGKVADWNMAIASAKKYNEIPLIQFFVPDKIANLKFIEIPK